MNTAMLFLRTVPILRGNCHFRPGIISSLCARIDLSRRHQLSTSIEPNQEKGETTLQSKILKFVADVKFKLSKTRFRRVGYLLFINMDEKVDFSALISELQLEDTFFSYYLLCELHVWMLMCRLGDEGREGKEAKKHLCEALWNTMDMKSRKLGLSVSRSERTEKMSLMGTHFNAAMFNYDEGVMSDDKTLAGALWRSLYFMRDVSPITLAKAVRYVRVQMKHLDEQNPHLILRRGIVSFANDSNPKL